MPLYPKLIADAVPPELASYADPATIEVIEWIMRLNRSSLNSLTRADFRRETTQILADLISDPTEARIIYRSCEQPEPAWLDQPPAQHTSAPAVPVATLADVVRQYRQAAAARRALTGSSAPSTNAALRHTLTITDIHRTLLAGGHRTLLRTLKAEADLKDKITDSDKINDPERLLEVASRRRAATAQVTRLLANPDADTDWWSINAWQPPRIDCTPGPCTT